MKHLWAPWRLQYVQKGRSAACFLCHALKSRNDRDNLLLYRGDKCSIVMNRYPYSSGHLMLFPHRHTGDLSALTPVVRAEIMHLVARCEKTLRQVLRPHGFNIGMNVGGAAGAGLADHLHMHIVPRWTGDTNFMPVIADARIVPQFLLDLYDRIHPHIGR